MDRNAQKFFAPNGSASNFDASSLSEDTRRRLVEKFFSFREDRAKIHRRMESYVIDYQLAGEGATKKYISLEEQYSVDAPNLNHLVFREGGCVLWSSRDIAIVLGRNVSNVQRNLRRMEMETEWAPRLARFSFNEENPGRGAATHYAPEIFDLIVDYFEERYLERVTHPRHGKPLAEAEKNAVRSFWQAMRDDPDGVSAALAASASGESPTNFGVLYQCFRIIVKRAFSVKLGAFFLALFAIVFELSRRFPVFNFVAPLASALALAVVLAMMIKRRGYAPWLADIGACAVMFCVLWGLATLATPGSYANRLLPDAIAGKRQAEERAQPAPTVYIVRLGESYESAGLGHLADAVLAGPPTSPVSDEAEYVRVLDELLADEDLAFAESIRFSLERAITALDEHEDSPFKAEAKIKVYESMIEAAKDARNLRVDGIKGE